jgi:hypothetical protein
MRWACLSDGDCADGVSLAIEQSRIRRRYEKAMLAGNCHIAGYWASRYEDIWGEEASAEMQSEVNEEHQLWKR